MAKIINLRNGAKLGDHRRIGRRWEHTRDFVKKHLGTEIVYGNLYVLDIGSENVFGRQLALEFSLKYSCTVGDLDLSDWTCCEKIYGLGVIFCFEILEHLKNPDLFLEYLHSEWSLEHTKLFVSFPQNPLFLRGQHFHEFKDDEFLTLIDPYFEIVAHKRMPLWNDWWFYFTGIRPMLRFFCQLFGLSRWNLYYLKPK